MVKVGKLVPKLILALKWKVAIRMLLITLFITSLSGDTPWTMWMGTTPWNTSHFKRRTINMRLNRHWRVNKCMSASKINTYFFLSLNCLMPLCGDSKTVRYHNGITHMVEPVFTAYVHVCWIIAQVQNGTYDH